MKLNPSKCAFGISASKFLGFMVSQRGIEVSPDQVKAVIETPPPRNKKELQRLTGKLVALGHFIARFTDELRPFLGNTKSGTNGWTTTVKTLLKRLNTVLCSPILSSLIPKEKLYMYLAVSEWAISVVLFRCPSPKEQKPIYYVSRALADVETRYSKMELTALALRSAAQKLRPYFQAHPVVVLTDQPLRNILHKPDLTGRMLAMGYRIERPSQRQESSEKEWWTLRVDGASRSSGSGVGLLLQSPTGEHLEQAIRLGFPASNNEAEYEAILSGLDLVWLYPSPSSGSIVFATHSKTRPEGIRSQRCAHGTISDKSKGHLQRFTEWTIEKIRRTENGRATPGRHRCLPPHQRSHIVAYTCANQPFCQKPPLATPLGKPSRRSRWTNNITEYLRTGTLPEIQTAHKVRVQAARFTLIGGTCTSDPSQTLPSVPKSFRGPVCVSRVTRGSMWKSFRRTLSST
ncbi:Retrovirus-related Pol polyprotein from transposon opus [Vitis vinifera]|uniref:Retrovirus-related Pol polyprotein from transposon opus n=1 Tax=Vitis vinifera TaxID=29760 RepID=A0A438DG51_VITVI|nr:Retrovirus-related Pol polyprotein from transposon opus [Vitis vinifera]